MKQFCFRLDCAQDKGEPGSAEHGMAAVESLQFYPGVIANRCVLELLCPAHLGRAEGFQEKGGRAESILKQGRIQQRQNPTDSIEPYRDAVLAYVRQMGQGLTENRLAYQADLGMVREYLDILTGHPPERIGEYFCRMPFPAGGENRGSGLFAPPVSKTMLTT